MKEIFDLKFLGISKWFEYDQPTFLKCDTSRYAKEGWKIKHVWRLKIWKQLDHIPTKGIKNVLGTLSLFIYIHIDVWFLILHLFGAIHNGTVMCEGEHRGSGIKKWLHENLCHFSLPLPVGPYDLSVGAHLAGSYPLHWQQLHQQYKVPQLCFQMPCWWSPIASSKWDQQITPKFTYVHIFFVVVQCCQDTLKWVWAARLGTCLFYFQMKSWWCDFGDWIVWGTDYPSWTWGTVDKKKHAPDDR